MAAKRPELSNEALDAFTHSNADLAIANLLSSLGEIENRMVEAEKAFYNITEFHWGDSSLGHNLIREALENLNTLRANIILHAYDEGYLTWKIDG
jgi:hypothetical protein